MELTMNRVKFLGVATDLDGQPTGTIWRMRDQRHMTTLVIPNERLEQLLAEASNSPVEVKNRRAAATPKGVTR